jgi:hypothetical protein
MRGFLKPARRHLPSEAQSAFSALSRHRRSRIAREAKTSLLKADQWGRGEVVDEQVAAALETGLKALSAPKKKKKAATAAA